MFTFNFLTSGDNGKCDETPQCKEAVEIKFTDKQLSRFAVPISVCTHNFGDSIELRSLPKDYLNTCLKEDVDIDLDIKQAEESHSDLVSGIYEGGLKIWECTFDLGHYLINNKGQNYLQKKTILDLGCGAGLLGILCCKLEAELVDFQDYNSGVLKHLTIPNFLLNFSVVPKVRFWYGDWGGFKHPCFYDLILTSETIYNPITYSKLHKLLKDCLKKDGLVILAAKSYYFGVGGSLGEFLSFVEKEGVFEYKHVWSSNEGVKREVVELCFKK